ncbi:hypothetical protein JCM3775_006263 [Rhodotorula graminis]|uniref:MARVEL domain-containing protein n=1 Tax=Rhodotorula graminis (strain WP1) TaxID=578459 RepID=A0A194S5F4_RHOGW|nr:uncharacterized protein RHOBADRAFT_44160 [Rhodotorula graminis WP1]KPV74646.1 hypothetical protein RHOBADRAFT_44160 [Rhodotorula graminis WP1]
MFSFTSDAYKGIHSANIARHSGDIQRTLLPSFTAVFAGGLAGAASWGQAQSKDLLPRYLMGPAIVGAVCCALYGIACVACFVLLQKYDNYHERKSGSSAHELKQEHPIGHWPRLVLMGTGAAATVAMGSYIYMLWGVLSDSEGDYCITWTPATSKAECDPDWSFVLGYAFALLALIVAGALNENVVQEAVDYFDNRKMVHAAGGLNSQQGGGNGAGKGYGGDGYDDSQGLMGGRGGGRGGYDGDSYA